MERGPRRRRYRHNQRTTLMAQWTVALDPSVRRADGTCEVRVRTNAVDDRGQPLYATVILRDGETVRTDDATVAAALNTLRTAGQNKVFNTLAVRPPNPTHDVDTRPREPLPDRSGTARVR